MLSLQYVSSRSVVVTTLKEELAMIDRELDKLSARRNQILFLMGLAKEALIKNPSVKPGFTSFLPFLLGKILHR